MKSTSSRKQGAKINLRKFAELAAKRKEQVAKGEKQKARLRFY
jgi:hypothetical protein